MEEKIKCACGCGNLLTPTDKYGRKRTHISGHNNRKYDDPTEYKRAWNHRNRDKRYVYKKKYTRERKIMLIGISGNACQHCGLKFDGTNDCVFDFHHNTPTDKKFGLNLAMMNNKSWDSILKEHAKCSLLCANCHRLEHNNYN